MSFHVFGCTHREAELELRQRMAISPAEMDAFLTSFVETFPETEVVAVSTCNRVEIYTYCADDTSAPLAAQIEFFATNRGLESDLVSKTCFQLSGATALEHLFNVASSLDSMALGDIQIIAQVRRAHDFAAQAKTVGPALNLAFQTAIKTAKRIDTETEIHRHRTSIASIAVKDFAKNIFENFSGKKVLVIGAGEMAEETLEYLKEDGADSFVVVNRTFAKAQELALKKGGTAVEWTMLDAQILSADLIITAVGGTEPILTAQQFRDLNSRRRRQPLFILDLGVPRNVDCEIGKFPEIYLFSIDDLEQTCQKNRQARERQLPKAHTIIKEEIDRFVQELTHRRNLPILSKLRNDWESIMNSELKRLFNKNPQFSESDQQAIEQSFERLLNKILNSPYQTLRSESKNGTPGTLLDSIVKLFRLK